MSDSSEFTINLANYYGRVKFNKKEDGRCYMELEDFDGFDQLEISKEFFEMAKKEFSE